MAYPPYQVPYITDMNTIQINNSITLLNRALLDVYRITGDTIPKHNFLSSYHLDTIPDALQPGDMFYVNSASKITRLPIGEDGYVIKSTNGYPVYGEEAAAASGAPTNATYVCISANATLTAERTLAVTAPITLADAGANGAVTIDIDVAAPLSVSGGNLLIADGAITEAKLDINDAPADGEFLQWSDAAGKPQWAVAGGAPTDATYICVSADASLTAERTLAGEATVITLTDAGANGALTISLTALGITAMKIANATITEDKLDINNAPTDAYYLQWSDGVGKPVWAAGVGGGAPVDATYVCISANGTLTAERVLTAGNAINISDLGANNPVTVSIKYASPLGLDGSGNLYIANNSITWQKFYTAGDTPVAGDFLKYNSLGNMEWSPISGGGEWTASGSTYIYPDSWSDCRIYESGKSVKIRKTTNLQNYGFSVVMGSPLTDDSTLPGDTLYNINVYNNMFRCGFYSSMDHSTSTFGTGKLYLNPFFANILNGQDIGTTVYAADVYPEPCGYHAFTRLYNNRTIGWGGAFIVQTVGNYTPTYAVCVEAGLNIYAEPYSGSFNFMGVNVGTGRATALLQGGGTYNHGVNLYNMTIEGYALFLKSNQSVAWWSGSGNAMKLYANAGHLYFYDGSTHKLVI